MNRSSDQASAAPRQQDAWVEYAGHRFHYLWLRDNCQCGQCLHPSGQRLHETWQLDPDARPRTVELGERALYVEWQDGHRSSYSAEFLDRHAYDAPAPRGTGPTLWDGTLDPADLTFGYQDVAGSDRARLRWLQAVRDYGLAFLSEVPAEPGTILRVIG